MEGKCAEAQVGCNGMTISKADTSDSHFRIHVQIQYLKDSSQVLIKIMFTL